MLIFHHKDQALHDPERVFRGGKYIPQVDRAERYKIFLDIVTHAGHDVRSAELSGMNEILEIHDPAYVEFLKTVYSRWEKQAEFGPDAVPNVHPTHRMSRKPQNLLGELGWYSNSTSCPITRDTWKAVFASACVALNGARSLGEGAKQVYALCRPPGHHAFPDMMSGVCFLNNASIAAQQLTKRFGKVTVVDLDVHHGNGTQHIFYRRSDVLFCSIHADPSQRAPFYAGYDDEIGADAGEGFNLNMPLPVGTGDEVWLNAVIQVVRRIMAFNPGAIVISLGFDGSIHDPMKTFQLTNNGFAKAASLLAALNVPTLLVQEGGYINPQLGACLQLFLATFQGG